MPSEFSLEEKKQSLELTHPPCWARLRSRCFLSAHARLSGGGVGVGGDAVLGEDRFKLLQRGVCSDPGRVEVSPAHPEAGLRQVLKELVEPVHANNPHNTHLEPE